MMNDNATMTAPVGTLNLTVGALNADHVGKLIRLPDGAETHTGRLMSVTHLLHGTRVETELHWEGSWPRDTVCSIVEEKVTL